MDIESEREREKNGRFGIYDYIIVLYAFLLFEYGCALSACCNFENVVLFATTWETADVAAAAAAAEALRRVRAFLFLLSYPMRVCAAFVASLFFSLDFIL